MPMHSSSLQTRMSLNAGSREMGRSRPPLVTISGTERMNSTPLALIAAMMEEPLSSIVSSSAVGKSASMRDLQRQCGETSAPVPKRKLQTPATGLPRPMTAACGRVATPASWLRMNTPWSRLAAALVLAFAGSVIDPASAADWPTRPLRIIAPSTPGGAADMFGRLVCDHFSEAFHERCFVENRAGAGGLIGMAAAAQAAPDGYTPATSSIAYNVIAPAVSPNPGFDPMKDFTHIAYIGGPPNVLVVNPALNVHSLAELVALGRRGARLRLARRRHARTSGGGSLRAEGRHQAAADHDQRRLAGDDGPHQRQRERRHHDLDLGAGANPRRKGHPDRGHRERAPRGVSRPAGVQGPGLRRPHGGDVVRLVGAGGLPERYHAAPQRGGGQDVGAARRAQTPRP